MGEIKGFMKYKRQSADYRPVEERIHDFKELELPLTPEQIQQQAARCNGLRHTVLSRHGLPAPQ